MTSVHPRNQGATPIKTVHTELYSIHCIKHGINSTRPRTPVIHVVEHGYIYERNVVENLVRFMLIGQN